MNTADSRNDGHGHVMPRPDGYRSRCGGPAMCGVCQRERAALEATHPTQDERGQGLLNQILQIADLYRNSDMTEGNFTCRVIDAIQAAPLQPVALSTLTDSGIVKQVKNSFDSYDHAEINRRELVQSIRAALAASAPAQQAGHGWKLVPVEPSTAMVSAMACSRARDDEEEFPPLMDLIDYSGENKTHTVLKAAYQAMLTATPPQLVAAEAVAAFDEAVAAELPRVSHVQFDSHEICKHFAENLRKRMAGTGSDESKKENGNV